MAKKLYYKIGEACKMLGIQPYVLRYWETEFPLLSPTKSKSGQRVYSDQDLKVIRRIKELLYDEGYTIAGAKKQLEGDGPILAAEPEEKVEPKAKPKAKSKTKPKASAEAKAKAKAKPKAASSADEIAEATERVEQAEINDPEVQKALRAALSEARELLELLDA